MVNVRAPEYQPPTTPSSFSSIDLSDEESAVAILSHAAVNIKTIDVFNPYNVMILEEERNKLRLNGIHNLHPLLYQIYNCVSFI